MKTKFKKSSNITSCKTNIIEAAKLAINAKESGNSVIIPNLCNNVDIYDLVSSVSSLKDYPEIKTNYHLLGKNFLAKNPGYVQFIDIEREKEYNRTIVVANMICNNGINSKINQRPINYAYLIKSMVDIKKFIIRTFNTDNKVKIYMPKFHSKSGANWGFVSLLIEDIWSDINVVIF
ncbi:MAG TPA: hypothetical protein VMX17_05685 [Candidatus Glassbacteria bacterium]|nr:hypothetical protein [Candidatus Glassbacteria bacterium]